MQAKSIGILGLLFSGLACSQEAKDEAYLFSLSFEDLLQVEVTGATRTASELTQVPSAVTVFTQEEIVHMGIDNLTELMALVPGYQSYRSNITALNQVFSSRGRRVSNVSSEVLVLVDGQRLEEIASNGLSALVPQFPLSHVQRVEFIRGPGSSVYGSNAMMGVINIVTVSGVDNLRVAYGSNQRRLLGANVHHRFERVELNGFVQTEKDAGADFRVLNNSGTGLTDTDDPRQVLNSHLRLNWQTGQLVAQHHETFLNNFFELGLIDNQFNYQNGRFSGLSIKQQLPIEHFDSSLSLGISTSRITERLAVVAPGGVANISEPSSLDAVVADTRYDGRWQYRAVWDNNWQQSEQTSWQFGMDVRRVLVDEAVIDSNFDVLALIRGQFPIAFFDQVQPASIVQLASDRTILGFYGQYQRQWHERWFLTLGLRYDDFSEIGSELSPRLGLVYALDNTHHIKALYGQAFRAPTEVELTLVNNALLLGNPQLQPETVNTSELIWVSQWSQSRLSLGYFYNDFDNSVVQTSVANGLRQYQNRPQSASHGVELEWLHPISDNWLMRGSYTRIFSNTELAFREAQSFGSLTLNYQQTGWNLNVIASYQGERQMPVGGSDQNRIALDDYWLIHAKFQYRLTPDCQFSLSAKNLFDEDYQTPSATSTRLEGVPNRGREWLLSFDIQY